MLLHDLTAYLDTFLDHARFSGDHSLNGLQVEGAAAVQTVALAVDASQTAIDGALAAGAELLLTHHGLFWGRALPLAGMIGKRVRTLMRNDLSLYVSHLPLDAHPQVGNNAEILRLLELTSEAPFGEYRGATLGFIGALATPLALEDFLERVRTRLGTPASELRVWGQPAGPLRRVAVVSGGAAGEIDAAIAAGCDALLTGEPAYGAVFPALELGVPLICAGHYYTETLGVQALGAHLEREFGLTPVFVPGPVGL